MAVPELTVKKIITLREDFWAGESNWEYKPMAERYGITDAQVRNIVHGRQHPEIPGTVKPWADAEAHRAKTREDFCRLIRAEYSHGYATRLSLAVKYNVTVSLISKILRGERGGPKLRAPLRSRVTAPNEPCLRGHDPIEKTFRKDGACRKCRQIDNVKYLAANPEKRDARNRKKRDRPSRAKQKQEA